MDKKDQLLNVITDEVFIATEVKRFEEILRLKAKQGAIFGGFTFIDIGDEGKSVSVVFSYSLESAVRAGAMTNSDALGLIEFSGKEITSTETVKLD